MNVLFVTHAYPRSEGDVAGVFIERLAVALHERNHGVRVVAPSDRGRGGSERKRGIEVSRVRYAPKPLESLAYTGTMVEGARTPLGALAAANLMRAQAREIRRLGRTGAVDVVHAHWWVPAGVSAWLAQTSGSKPYVVTLHGTDVRILERSRVGQYLARRVLGRAAVVTAVSSYLAEKIATVVGIDAARIVVQPMPIQVGNFGRASQGGGGVVVVGRLTNQKNLGVVLDAVACLKRDGQTVTLKLIGDGPERKALERKVEKLNLVDQVRFEGAVEPEQVPAAVGNADVTVFAATGEGYGLAAAESFMLGVPVVALESGGGVRDVVPPHGPGRLVPAGDADSLAKAIAEFLNHSESRRLAAELGQSLKKRLSPAAVAGVFESVYEDAAKAAN